jgi:hypothetical protein
MERVFFAGGMMVSLSEDFDSAAHFIALGRGAEVMSRTAEDWWICWGLKSGAWGGMKGSWP